MITEAPQGLVVRKRLRAMRLIQDAALGIAETRGYEAATMGAIAAAAEVSMRSAYRYFGWPTFPLAVLEDPANLSRLVAVLDRIAAESYTAPPARTVGNEDVAEGDAAKAGVDYETVIRADRRMARCLPRAHASGR